MLLDYAPSSPLAVFLCAAIYVVHGIWKGFSFYRLRSFFTHVVTSAVIVGLVFFSYGHFWLMHSDSGNPQAYLIGFILGAIGVNSGLILGAIIWLVRQLMDTKSLNMDARDSGAH